MKIRIGQVEAKAELRKCLEVLDVKPSTCGGLYF